MPTVRDADGLALSSRNAYLSDEERPHALALPRALSKAAERISGGVPVDEAIEQAKQSLRHAGFEQVDYVALVDGASLEPISEARGSARLIAAAKIGKTRLIDNLAVEVIKQG